MKHNKLPKDTTSCQIVIITGPTASGKSNLALKVAQKYKGEIINADSIQLYADLPTLTARPTSEETGLVPHHLYGILGPEEYTSAMAWRSWAQAAIKNVQSNNHIPIICGGTGLYIKALLKGLSPVPTVSDDIKQDMHQWVTLVGAPAAHEYLTTCDPLMGQTIRPSDTQRITRALAVLKATGQSLAYWQSLPPTEPGCEDQSILCILEASKPWIYERCDRRFDLMVQSGIREEVTDIVNKNIPLSAPIFRACGSGEVAAALRGEIEWADAIEKAKRETRRLAKRQIVWNTTQYTNGMRFSAENSKDLLADICQYIEAQL